MVLLATIDMPRLVTWINCNSSRYPEISDRQVRINGSFDLLHTMAIRLNAKEGQNDYPDFHYCNCPDWRCGLPYSGVLMPVLHWVRPDPKAGYSRPDMAS